MYCTGNITVKAAVVLIGLCSIFRISAVSAQDIGDERFKELAVRLEEYAAEFPKIDKEIDIAITGTLQDFAIAFSKETKLNLVIDPSINQRVVVNFAETKPRDILLYLCKFYNLDISFSGTILALIAFKSPPPEAVAKTIKANYNAYNNKLELDLRFDTLDLVLKKISEITQTNLIPSKAASTEVVSGYVGPTDLDDALEQMARRNDLVIYKTDKNYYLVDKKTSDNPNALIDNRTPAANTPNTSPVAGNLVQMSKDSSGTAYFSVHVQGIPMIDIIREASQLFGCDLVLYAEPNNPVTLQVDSIPFRSLLDYLFNGSKYGYTEENNIYFIGDRNLEGVRQSVLHQMQHRSVKDIIKYIPKDILADVHIDEFIELNSLILSGSSANITQVINFLKDIDKTVPVVNIELTIVDVTKSSEVNVGLEFGVANKKVTPGGVLYPGVDFTFSSDAVNQLLGMLSNNNIINLGKVKPNFYATLKAIEDNGYANVNSKPRLSTINGREATFTIGETRYYEVRRTTLQGDNNPISLQDRNFQSVNADFTIRIVPIISGDENVTLEIDVKQSDFIGQISNDAPPAQVNRSFNSNIRIKNEDMIVLGGLESKSVSGSGSGVPGLARIPILKWFFGKQRRSNEKSKLLIFIKPTILY